MPQPFRRRQVRLLDGPVRARQSLTGAYLLALDPDRLLHNFRINAGLPSSAAALGGWESPECGLRGHFVGHYLSACSQMYAATGDERFQARAAQMTEGLLQCQAALGEGYLSAFPVTQFDILEREFGGTWAPYYTLHKVLAGLLDAHREAEIDTALPAARQLGDWVVARMGRLPEHVLEPMLKTTDPNPSNEYGGIGEAMYLLYRLTEEPRYLQTARLFDRGWFLEPLIQSQDHLAGLHANTHIPQALAAARRYEITGDAAYRRAVAFFWERTALARSYANGGSSGPRPDRRERSEGGEHWPEAFGLKGTLTPKINESCVANNMLRLTDLLFTWTADPRYAAFRERVFLNSVLAMQRPGEPGRYLYSHPLAPGSRKIFGEFDRTFWCCYGTTIEAYAGLGDGIYFHDADTLWITQYMASSLAWPEQGIRLTQRADLQKNATVDLMLHAERPVSFSLRLRIPDWAAGATWSVNGDPPRVATDRELILQRTWRDGDTVQLHLPMSVRTETLPGDEQEIAIFYGPTLLAARTAHALELGLPADGVGAAIRCDQTGRPSAIRLGFGGEATLAPVSEIVDEPYGVYFKTT